MPTRGKDPADGSKDVDTYLAQVPNEARAALEKVRKTIRAAAPKATEGISYGFPTFKLEGRAFIWYAAWKNHCSIYPLTSSLLEAHGKELAPYDTENGTIRFRPDKPLPAALVRKIVKVRLAEEARPRR